MSPLDYRALERAQQETQDRKNAVTPHEHTSEERSLPTIFGRKEGTPGPWIGDLQFAATERQRLGEELEKVNYRLFLAVREARKAGASFNTIAEHCGMNSAQAVDDFERRYGKRYPLSMEMHTIDLSYPVSMRVARRAGKWERMGYQP